MRVIMTFAGYNLDPCGSFIYGEAEDYTEKLRRTLNAVAAKAM
jgi:hypothetical protein